MKTRMWRCLLFTTLIAIYSFFNLSYADSALTKQKDVDAFINMMVKKHNFKKSELVELFEKVTVRKRVIDLFNKPFESKPWTTYKRLYVDEKRINNGVQFWKDHAKTLAKVQKEYGVDPSVIVATIGVETRYGKYTGGFKVIDALSSLGFEQKRRSKFFRKELEQFLLLTREQHLDPMKVTGSYAGAIGVPQFMPSSYRRYAIDYTKNGSADLMSNIDDVIGSVANYYKRKGWAKGQPVAIQVAVNTKKYDQLKKKLKPKQLVSMELLENNGVTPKGDHKYKDLKAKVIDLHGKKNDEYWVGFHNFEVIRRYNPSDKYAMAVYQLSDRIKTIKERQ